MLWKCLSTERTFALLLAGSTLLMGCEHEASLDQARASAEAHQAEGVVAAAGKNPEQLKKAINRIRSIRGGTKIQQANRDLLLASTQIKLGQVEVDAFNTVELSLRNEISHLNILIDLMHSLQVFIDERDISIDQLGSDPLQQRRAQLETTQAALHRQLSNMQAPVNAMDEEIASQSARISDLRRAAESLREEQASLGVLEGFDAFQRSVDVDNEADMLEIEVARRQILLDLETQPILDHTRLASVQTQEHIDEVTAAHGTLEAIVDSYSSQTRSARTLLNRMNDEVNAAMQSLNDQYTGPLAQSYASARSNLEKAASDARSGSRSIDKVGKNAASLLQSQAHLLVFQVDGSRLRGLMERQGLLGRLSSNRVIGNRDSYAMQLKKVENTIAEVNAGAKAAGEAAIQSLGNVRGGEVDQIRSEIETTMNMMGLASEMEQAAIQPETPSTTPPPANPVPDPVATGPSYDTPQALVEYINSLVGSPQSLQQKLQAIHAVSYSTTPEAREGNKLQLEFLDAFQGLWNAVQAKFGDASSPTLVMIKTQIDSSVSKMHLDSLKSTTDTTAEITVEQQMGPPITQYLVKTEHGWMIDEDENYARTPALAEGMKQLPMMIAAFQSVTKQVQDGTISNSMGIDMAIGQALSGGSPAGP